KGAAPWLAASFLAFVLLALVERRHPHPIFPPALLRLRHVVGAYLVCFLWSAGNLAFPVKLFVQDVLKYTPMAASLAFLPATLVGGVAGLAVARLAPRLGLAKVLLGGLFLQALATLAFVSVVPGSSYWAMLLPAAMLGHAAFMAAWIAVRLLAVEGIPAADFGVAGGAIYATQHLGNAVGVPALMAILHAATKGGSGPVAGFHAMFLGGTIFVLLALATAFLLCRNRTAPSHEGA
ncbi:MAG TPA: MFS transporter, partial [Candidatus Methylacidiphilales bacterium]